MPHRYSAPPLRRRLLRALLRLPVPRALKRRLFVHGDISIKVDDAHSFLMRTRGEYIESDLHRSGFGRGWEGVSLRAWAHLAPQAATILDIGAHRGVYALAAKCLNPRARVIAFEPLEPSFRRLMKNAELNGFQIEGEQLAVSDSNGRAVLFQPLVQHALASIERPPRGKSVPIQVATTTLDDYARRNQLSSIDLVKIDVEGHEAAVLRGMSQILARWRPAVLIEVLTEDAGAAVIDLLGPHDYNMYRVSETDGLDPIVDIGPKVHRIRNFLFCRPEMFATAGLSELLIGSPGRE